jgi:hypothetical protein
MTDVFKGVSLSANVSTPTVITALSFSASAYEGCILEYRIKEATSNKVRIGRLLVAASGTGTTCSCADQYTETDVLGAAAGLVIDAVNDNGTLKIRYNNTHASNSCSMKCEMKRLL